MYVQDKVRARQSVLMKSKRGLYRTDNEIIQLESCGYMTNYGDGSKRAIYADSAYRLLEKEGQLKSNSGRWRERYRALKTEDGKQIFIYPSSSEPQSPLIFICTNARKSGLSVCVSSARLNASLASASRCIACNEIP